jgi:hypothetical protein
MKNITKLITLLAVLMFVTSCSTNYDDFNSVRNDTIGFTISATLELPLSQNTPEINFPLSYFVSTSSSEERTFNVVVVEEDSDLPPESYSFDASVVVPANERSGVLVFSAYNINLTNEYRPLVLEFESSAAVTSGNRMNIALKTND